LLILHVCSVLAPGSCSLDLAVAGPVNSFDLTILYQIQTKQVDCLEATVHSKSLADAKVTTQRQQQCMH